MFENTIKTVFEDSIRTKNLVVGDKNHVGTLERMAKELVSIYQKGGKVLIAGNGGSAADAQHFAAEITCQFLLQLHARLRYSCQKVYIYLIHPVLKVCTCRYRRFLWGVNLQMR